MERQKGEYARFLDGQFKTALFLWKGNPESPEAISKIKGLLNEASDLGMGITFRINDRILQSSEGRRAILMSDLKRLAVHEDGNFVFKFGAKKTSNAEYLLTTKKIDEQGFLILHGRHDGMIGIFRPHEIESFEVNESKRK